MAEVGHASVIATTTRAYLKGHWEDYLQNNPIASIFKAKGHVKTGCTGTSVDWAVKCGRYAPENIGSYEDRSGSVQQHNHHLRVNVGWGKKVVDTAVSKDEFRLQGEKETLVKLQTERIPSMGLDLIDDGIFYDFLNADGTTGTLPTTGLAALYATYTAGSDKDNKVASATLAAGGSLYGQSMTLNGVTSVDNAEPDAWTPTLVNVGATWTSSTGFTSTNAYAIVSQAIGRVKFSQKKMFRADCGVFNFTHYQTLKAAVQAQERIIREDSATTKKFGMGSGADWIPLDGVDITWDEHCPAGVSHILNLDQIWLDCVDVGPSLSGDKVPGGKKGEHGDMFSVEVAYTPYRDGVYIRTDWMGQFRINPRYQCILADFTS